MVQGDGEPDVTRMYIHGQGQKEIYSLYYSHYFIFQKKYPVKKFCHFRYSVNCKTTINNRIFASRVSTVAYFFLIDTRFSENGYLLLWITSLRYSFSD